MIRKQFPDLGSLKKFITQSYQNKKGWPTAILNVHTQQDYRPDVKGALSIFMNISGESHCTVDNRQVTIPEAFFFVTNQQQHYTLAIETSRPVETFNIHFADRLVEQVYESLLLPSDYLLQNSGHINGPQLLFYNQLHRKDAYLMGLIQAIRQAPHYQVNTLSLGQQFASKTTQEHLWLEEKLYEILVYLLQLHRNILKKVEQLPPIKQTTRVELYKRLGFALDYLHSFAHCTIQLDDLAQTACLSKYHFLRLFKQVFGLTPYQYLAKIRLENAQSLLKTTQMTVHEIAYTIGYENATSFCRVFRQRFKVSPQQYRSMIG
ncbi:transcriptional regulator, AraC family protein [Microscilla marina ATCC 23134]|uniref:Transcriptional regulator, AraC family protein n=2 Tax=Microscilla marina TaxID=1027 RepID=A1ZUD1_MICM2|nr:transcriptional regulator, AraC family protein [Microscilla marina ATCC 23134]